ncbi:MAG TPA: hypothetical protein VEB39_09605 [Sphingomicrobium sp.]|nr:hypothetical protein [Sphingomicrobium sp.]
MTDQKSDQKKPGEKQPPPTLSGAPDQSIELKVKKHPDDQDAKVDLGSDESMDASDPSSAAQPGTSNEPAPSSGFPEQPAKK